MHKLLIFVLLCYFFATSYQYSLIASRHFFTPSLALWLPTSGFCRFMGAHRWLLLLLGLLVAFSFLFTAGALYTFDSHLRASRLSFPMQRLQQAYTIVEKGTLHSLNYRVYFSAFRNFFTEFDALLFTEGPKGIISPWHDIPLVADQSKKIFNMIVEIPRWSNAKMEASLLRLARAPCRLQIRLYKRSTCRWQLKKR